MARSLNIDIVTPERVLLSEEVTSVVAPGVLGSFGVLPNHAPMLAELATGELRFRRDTGLEGRIAVKGGFLQVFQNQVTVLADAAEPAEEIDTEAVRRQLEELRERLREARLQGALREAEELSEQMTWAQTRLRVAGGA